MIGVFVLFFFFAPDSILWLNTSLLVEKSEIFTSHPIHSDLIFSEKKLPQKEKAFLESPISDLNHLEEGEYEEVILEDEFPIWYQ